MKLKSLTLENFQGVKSLHLDFEGRSARIYGTNEAGKTTLFNSFTWLLFDKNSTGTPNYTPQTIGPTGEPVHHLNHSVEGTFIKETGQLITFKKIYHEIYRTVNGTTEEKMASRTTDYYVDGVPTKEKEYTDILNNLCGNAEKMKILTMPHYFSEGLSWSDRRKILLDMCGDIPDKDVIKKNKELKELNHYLLMPGTEDQYYPVDDYIKIAKSQKVNIKKDLDSIPGRIDEAKRAMPDVAETNTAVIDLRIAELLKKKDELEAEKIKAASRNSAGIRNKISEAYTRLGEARAAYNNRNAAINDAVIADLNKVKIEQMTAKSALQDLKEQLTDTIRKINMLNDHRQDLVDKYRSIQYEKWDESKEVCPTCKRALPPDDVQSSRNTFEENKDKRLKAIVEQSKQEGNDTTITSLAAKRKEITENIEMQESIINDYQTQLIDLQGKLQTPQPFETTKEFADINDEIEELKAEESNASIAADNLATILFDEIKSVAIGIQAQEELKTKIAIANVQRARIEELTKLEKKLSYQYEQVEKGIYLCETFIRTKVGMLSDKINNKFKSVRFQLFAEQQNGGIVEKCEVLIPSAEGNMVPYSEANHAGKINAGIEIIEALSKHWNLSLPIFFDNAESVVELQPVDAQVIKLYVCAGDTKLRILLEQ